MYITNSGWQKVAILPDFICEFYSWIAAECVMGIYFFINNKAVTNIAWYIQLVAVNQTAGELFLFYFRVSRS